MSHAVVAIPIHKRPEGVSDLHWELHVERIKNFARCIEHDLSGPTGSGFVFATCSKCGILLRVRIEDD